MLRFVEAFRPAIRKEGSLFSPVVVGRVVARVLVAWLFDRDAELLPENHRVSSGGLVTSIESGGCRAVVCERRRNLGNQGLLVFLIVK